MMGLINTLIDKYEKVKGDVEAKISILEQTYEAKQEELREQHGDPEDLETGEALKKIIKADETGEHDE